MSKLLFVLFLVSSIGSSQTLIGKFDGVSITLEDGHYEVIFQSECEGDDYVSFYMNQGEGTKDGLDALKTYVFRLFEEKVGDYLLQFADDSLLLVYEDEKIRMELWRHHDGDKRFTSKWFTKTDYLELLGGIAKTHRM